MPDFKIANQDPFSVLSSAEWVVLNASNVFIGEKNLDAAVFKILERFSKGLESQEQSIGLTGDFESDLQLVFLEDCVNFCFWPDKNEKQWFVEWPKGNITPGGWYGLKNCFERAYAEGIPIFNAEYLSSITLNDAEKIFSGTDNTKIPLLSERAGNLKEAGEVLSKKFSGKFLKAVIKAEFDAVKLVEIIKNNFSSFRDVSNYKGKEIVFLKRAQITACDTNYVLNNVSQKLSNMDKLTAFADYRIPQVLREFGVINYSENLAEKVDNKEEIPRDSEEEVEIRAAAILAVELLRQKIKIMSAWEIDNILWLLSQDIKEKLKPHHRTRTIYY